MKKHTEAAKKTRLREALDQLSEENQRYTLGVLQALVFAQTTQEMPETRQGCCASDELGQKRESLCGKRRS
ncbi:MAG: hypothetical protein LBC60_10845 [Spirochaetaceae bacterium]|jgi:hypothetical protein|nr:hypothetical protein [Spirochaetaceae bacterium]